PCRKAVSCAALFVFGWCLSSSAFALTSGGLLPRSELLNVLNPPAPSPVLIDASSDVTAPVTVTTSTPQADPIENLVSLAMQLRDIRYRRGGGNPNSGFDCSGFVSYVFLHSLGLNLPRSSAEQFVHGMKVARD